MLWRKNTECIRGHISRIESTLAVKIFFLGIGIDWHIKVSQDCCSASQSWESLSVQLFVTHGLHAAHQASLSSTVSQSLFKLMYTEAVMPSNHLILCGPLLLLPSIFSSIRVFSNESALHIRWPKYWSFSSSISPCSEYSGLISFRLTGLIFLLSKAQD